MEDDEEECTQPTQPVVDPRRWGGNSSGLSDKDLTDVICILAPGSLSAINTVTHVAKHNPKHILQNADLLYDSDDLDTKPAANVGGREIALRLSSRVKDMCDGFRFGRNENTCDIVFPDGLERRISNIHFRIFFSPDGVLMLQDTSTNGTLVDDTLLGGNYKKNPALHGRPEGNSRTLSHGSVISLVVPPGQLAQANKFLVRIPARHAFQREYDEKLGRYLDLMDVAIKARKDALARIAAEKPGQGKGAEAAIGTDTPADPNAPLLETATPAALAATKNLKLHQAAARPNRPANRVTSFPRDWTGGPKYNVVCTIGKGAFATVYKVSTKSTGKCFAAKQISKRHFHKSINFNKKFEQEMAIMKQLIHTNIVRYVEHFVEGDAMYIIMEYLPLGDLSRFIDDQGPLSESLAQSMMRQMLDALSYLHSLNIAHRDIKPENILIDSVEPFIVKLSDFGLSKAGDEQNKFMTFCGTLFYCAPEVFSNSKRPFGAHREPRSYSHACDIWSLGAVLFMCLCRKVPFPCESNKQEAMFDVIQNTTLDVTPLEKQGVSKLGIAFVQSMLNKDPNLRPNEDACLKHPWFGTEGDPNTEFKLSQDVEALELSENSRLAVVGSGDELSKNGKHRLDAPLQLSKRVRLPVGHALPAIVEVPSTPDSTATFDAHMEGLDQKQENIPPLFGEIGKSAVDSAGVVLPNHLNVGMPAGQTLSWASSEASTLQRDMSVYEAPPYQQAYYRPEPSIDDLLVYSDSEPQPDASLYGTESLVGQLNVLSSHASCVEGGANRQGLLGMEKALGGTAPKLQHITKPDLKRRATNKAQAVHMDVPDLPGSEGRSNPVVGHGGRQKHFESKDVNRMVVDPATMSLPNLGMTKTDSVLPAGVRPSTQPKQLRAVRFEDASSVQDSEGDCDASGSRNMITDKSGVIEFGQTGRKTSGAAAKAGGSGIGSTASKAVATSTVNRTAVIANYAAASSTTTATMTMTTTAAATHKITTDAISIEDWPRAIAWLPLRKQEQQQPVASGVPESLDLAPPQLPMLGRLVSTPDSSSIEIALTQRETSWGRGRGNAVVYPHGHDTRVPKCAFHIIFWRDGIKQLIDCGIDWTTVSDVAAFVRTGPTNSIRVNGVPLTSSDKRGGPYGRLYTGDVITVFENKNKGGKAKGSGGNGSHGAKQDIKFVCEFFHGPSEPRRPPDVEPFVVEYSPHSQQSQ